MSNLMLAALLVPFAFAAAEARLASDLRPGMQLIYASESRDQPAWVVEFVEAGASLKEGADCARLRVRRQPGQAEVPEERVCVERDALYSWSSDQRAWLPQRPIGPHMELALTRPNGDTVRYTTGNVVEQVIGQLRLRVIETTVTTSDPTGKPKRRLTERYAVTLGTATGGRFEVPDPNTPDAWRTEQIFELREIR